MKTRSRRQNSLQMESEQALEKAQRTQGELMRQVDSYLPLTAVLLQLPGSVPATVRGLEMQPWNSNALPRR